MGNPAYEKLRDTKHLPSPTGVAMEILRLASDNTATLEQIAHVAQADPALAARLIKLVNSPFVGMPRTVASVSVAVKMLGLRSVKNLALSLSLVSNNRNGQCTTFDYTTFWSESLARATAARHLAEELKSFVPDETFTVCLLSEIGRLAFATVYPKEYGDLLSRSSGEQLGNPLKLEQESFGINHNELCAEMMTEWHLDDFFCEAVRNQGDKPPQEKSESESRAVQFSRLLYVAGLVASIVVQRQPQNGALKTITTEAAVLGIPEQRLDALFDAIVSDWRDVGAVFSVSTRETPSLEQLRVRASTSQSLLEEPSETSEPTTPSEDPSRPVHIMVVDDDPNVLQLVQRYLAGAMYRVSTVASAADALEIYRREAPQMIITDWMMPDMDGLEFCRRLRADEKSGWLFILMTTIKTEKGLELQALEAGADNFLGKPFSREELLAHVGVGARIIRLESNLAERGREIALYNARLTVANDKLCMHATTDELTGLINRREALSRLEQQWAMATRYEDPLCCIVADIDHFKRFNDVYGHLTGDSVIQTAATTLHKAARSTDIVCRMGGDEFLILCPRSTIAGASILAERMRSAITLNEFIMEGGECLVTATFGIAERSPSMQDPLELLKAADEALYSAKHAGRNRICVYGESANDDVSDLIHPSAEPKQHYPQPLTSVIRVLVVDDDPHVRKLCRRLMEKEGWTVSEAIDGFTALEAASVSLPDIIVMDMMMPGLNGAECAERLKANPVTREIPILILSSADTEFIESALAFGVEDFIGKPFRPKEFLLRIRALTQYRTKKVESQPRAAKIPDSDAKSALPSHVLSI